MGKLADLLKKYELPALNTILAATRPFRVGANVLAQGYGPALRALVGGDTTTPGKLESLIRESVTPEEQQGIEEKPLRSAIKSSAGMASIFSPVNASNIARATGVNALKGGMWGLGASEQGDELKDTLYGSITGGLLGGLTSSGKYVLGGSGISGKQIVSPEKYDEVLNINMPMQRSSNYVGFRPELEEIIKQYSNMPNKITTYRDLLQSTLPEYRGELSSRLGSTVYNTGNTYIRPSLDTSNLGSSTINKILKYLGPLLETRTSERD